MEPVRDLTETRVSLRRRLPDGGLGDVVGHLVEESDVSVTVLPEDRPAVVVRREDVTAMRRVPPRAARPASSAGALSRLLAGHWPGVRRARLGGWLLRWGHGFTSRANSVLVDGDPGNDPDRALALVAEWYAARGSSPLLFVHGGPDAPVGIDQHVLAATVAPDPRTTEVLVADLRRLGPVAPCDLVTQIEESPSREWLDLWRGGVGHGVHEYEVLTASPARYVVLREGSEAVACARIGTGERWALLSCVEVSPEARGRGVGRAVTVASLHEAATSTGNGRISFAAVEVAAENGPARALYHGLGFVPHHRYHYRVPA